jgi:hypothetical protein
MSTKKEKRKIYVTYSGWYHTLRKKNHKKRKDKYHCAKTKAIKNAIREIKIGDV